MVFNRRQNGNRQSRRQRSNGRSEPVDLMQLLRRRSRYRPYTMNNINNRSANLFIPNPRIRRPAENNISHVRNNPNSRRSVRRNNYLNQAVYQELTPLFNPNNRGESHDMFTNTETPCCATHCSATNCSAPNEQPEQTENQTEIVLGENVEAASEHDGSPELQNNSNNSSSETSNEIAVPETENVTDFSMQEVVTSEMMPIENTANNEIISSFLSGDRTPYLGSPPTDSSQSKSSGQTSTDVSGSSTSYTEVNELLRERHLTDELPSPMNLLDVNNAFDCYEDIVRNVMVPLHSAEQGFMLRPDETMQHLAIANCDNSFLALNQERTPDVNKSTTSSTECIKTRDDESNKSSSSGNIETKDSTKQINMETAESSSHEVVEISSTESNVETPASSGSLNLSATRFAFVEVYPNTSMGNNYSDSIISNEGDRTTPNTADNRAGGDGHHNDNVLQIQFSLTTVIRNNDEDADADGDVDVDEESNSEGEEE